MFKWIVYVWCKYRYLLWEYYRSLPGWSLCLISVLKQNIEDNNVWWFIWNKREQFLGKHSNSARLSFHFRKGNILKMFE